MTIIIHISHIPYVINILHCDIMLQINYDRETYNQFIVLISTSNFALSIVNHTDLLNVCPLFIKLYETRDIDLSCEVV